MPSLPPRHLLSKSTFVRGCQCVKSLWLYKNHFKLRDQPTMQQERIFMQGTDVGLLARQLFGNGVDASPTDVFHYRESVSNTAKYIAQGHTVIFEAAFQYEGILCAVDILIKHKDKWYVYEVKSSTSVKPSFLQDAALQYYVITNAGLALEDVFIVHINKGYTRCGDLQLRQLFAKQSVLQQVQDLQPVIISKAGELKLIASQKYMPGTLTGSHCTQPYLCDFYNFCWKDKMPRELYGPEEKVVDKKKSETLANPAEYSYHFININTYRTAVPEYDGHWPYRHIPFMFSVCTASGKNEPLQYQCFIAENTTDPCVQFVSELIDAFQSDGVILVAGKQFFSARLHELQNDYPGYAEALEKIIHRLKEFIVLEDEVQINDSSIKEDQLLLEDEDAAAAWYNLKLEKSNEASTKMKEEIKKYALKKIQKMAIFTGSK